MRKDIDDLRREHDKEEELENSFHTNPVKQVIQDMFQQEFSGSNYQKYTVINAKALVVEKIEAVLVKPGPYLPGGKNLVRKIKKMNTMEELLMKMNEYLFS